MINPTDTRLAAFGQSVFSEMGFTCLHPLVRPPPEDMAPRVEYGKTAPLEFDYLIPCGRHGLVGAITALPAGEALEDKYLKFCSRFKVLGGLSKNRALWRRLGVPEPTFSEFKKVTGFKGFFIAAGIEEGEVIFTGFPEIYSFYRSDWRVLVNCARVYKRYFNHPLVGFYRRLHKGRLSPFKVWAPLFAAYR